LAAIRRRRAPEEHNVYAVDRLRDGVELSAAQTETNHIGKRLGDLYPAENRDQHWVIVSLHKRVVGKIRGALPILFASLGCVLLKRLQILPEQPRPVRG
jgi:hypothetical protein